MRTSGRYSSSLRSTTLQLCSYFDQPPISAATTETNDYHNYHSRDDVDGNGDPSTNQQQVATGSGKVDAKIHPETCDWSILPFFASMNPLPACKFATFPNYSDYISYNFNTTINNYNINVDNDSSNNTGGDSACDPLAGNKSSLVDHSTMYDPLTPHKPEVSPYTHVPCNLDYPPGLRVNQSAFFKPYGAQGCMMARSPMDAMGPLKIPVYPGELDLRIGSGRCQEKPKIWSLANVAVESVGFGGRREERRRRNDDDDDDDDNDDDGDDDDFDDGVVEETVVDNDASSTWSSSASSSPSSSSSLSPPPHQPPSSSLSSSSSSSSLVNSIESRFQCQL